MIESGQPYQTLYVSRLVAATPYKAVHEIVTASRARNPARGITGALLFDGEYFGQLIEGEEAEVNALMEHIAADPRHTDVRILFRGVSGLAWPARDWRSGYCDAQQLDALAQRDSPRGAEALAIFLSIAQCADLE